MSKDLNNQIPWFATSNGVIDLQTSADHRDHRYTNNLIDKTNDNKDRETNNNDTASAKSKGSLKLSSNVSTKVTEGALPGLPPLLDKKRRPSPSEKHNEREQVIPSEVPPAPKDNELYGDILVIPPIREKEQFKNEKFSIPKLKVSNIFHICLIFM